MLAGDVCPTLGGERRSRSSEGGKQTGSATLHPKAAMSARFLMDRGMVESFWNGGEAPFAVSSLHTDSGPAFTPAGNVETEELVAYPVKIIWK